MKNKGVPTLNQLLSDIDNGDVNDVDESVLNSFSAGDRAAIQKALALRDQARHAEAELDDDDESQEPREDEFKRLALFEGAAAGADASNAGSSAPKSGKWSRTRTLLGLGLLWRGTRGLRAAAESEQIAVRSGEIAEEVALANRDVKTVMTALDTEKTLAKTARVTELAETGRVVTEVAEVSRLGRLVKGFGPVGTALSLFLLPGLVYAAVEKTAPKGEDAARTDAIARNAAVRVGLVDKDAQRDWLQGNRGKAVVEEAGRTVSDVWGFIKRVCQDPKAAFAEAKKTVEDVSAVAQEAVKNPEALAAGVRAIGEAGMDSNIVQGVRNAATAENPVQARGAALNALRAAQSNQTVLQSAESAANSWTPSGNLPPVSASPNAHRYADLLPGDIPPLPTALDKRATGDAAHDHLLVPHADDAPEV
jgi:hypothetical protein